MEVDNDNLDNQSKTNNQSQQISFALCINADGTSGFSPIFFSESHLTRYLFSSGKLPRIPNDIIKEIIQYVNQPAITQQTSSSSFRRRLPFKLTDYEWHRIFEFQWWLDYLHEQDESRWSDFIYDEEDEPMCCYQKEELICDDFEEVEEEEYIPETLEEALEMGIDFSIIEF